MDDLITFIRQHVWIPDERYYTVLASWTLDTWIHDYMETSPRLIFYATTRSGKTRALNTLRELSYHGLDMSSPTQATMFRLIEAFHPSLFIDEYQDLNQEVMPLIGSIFKIGFQDGGEVPRCDDDQDRTVRFFSVYSPIAIGLKNRQLMEDMLNRSITISMLEKPSSAEIERRIRKDSALALRGRLLGLRFKVQAGMIDLEPLKGKLPSWPSGRFQERINQSSLTIARSRQLRRYFCLRSSSGVYLRIPRQTRFSELWQALSHSRTMGSRTRTKERHSSRFKRFIGSRMSWSKPAWMGGSFATSRR